MKKQILFLAMFTMALIFAGTNNVFGQALDARTTPFSIDALTCISNSLPLHPVAGVPYLYKMNDPGEEKVYNWHWFATKDTTFINSTGLVTTNALTTLSGALLNTSANYNTSTVGADTVSITWSSELLAMTMYEAPFSGITPTAPSPTFVVAYGDGVNCADNIEVYEINPKPAFVIDIANIDPQTGTTLDWDVDTAQCVDIVQSATYNDVSNKIIMDYGADTLYFEVVASNFVTSWNPTFTISAGLSDSQIADMGIAANYADARTGNWITGTVEATGMVNADTENFGGIELTATDPADVNDGVSVFVRVIIHNNTFESLVSQTFTLAVDGQDFTDQWDLSEADCGDPTAAALDVDDTANHIIRPRPTIDGNPANYPATTEDAIPAPDNVINKDRN